MRPPSIAGVLLLLSALALIMVGCSTVKAASGIFDGVVVSVQQTDKGECKALLENASGSALAIKIPDIICRTPLRGMRFQVWTTDGIVDSLRWINAPPGVNDTGPLKPDDPP